jgi:hypothetical protein
MPNLFLKVPLDHDKFVSEKPDIASIGVYQLGIRLRAVNICRDWNNAEVYFI